MDAKPNPDYENATHGIWFLWGNEPLPVDLGGDGVTPHDPYAPISIGPPPAPKTCAPMDIRCTKCGGVLIPEEIKANAARTDKLCVGCFFDQFASKPLTLAREDEQGKVHTLDIKT